MDIYYFYNGINNIIKLALKDKKYLANYKLILNDPLVILDFQSSSNLKGGSALASKAKEAIGKATGAVPESPTNQESNSNSPKAQSNNKNELDTKQKALKILKVLFSIVYYLCLFIILPLLPFIAISYYSFKRLKIFYNEQMDTL